MILRDLKKEDISRLVELEKICFSDPWTENDFESSFSLPFFEGVAIEEDGAVVAYALALVVFEDGDIANVAVAPEYRKRGFGKLMMTALEEKALARGAERLFLEVRETNVSAIGLYTGRGFAPISVRKGYYNDGENAIVMQKNLN